MRRPAALAVLLGAVFALVRRRTRARRAESEVWTTAAAPPDLR